MSNTEDKQPDLDWSQVRETVKLLTVAVTQVETGMKNGDSSVNTLTNSFTSLVGNMNSIKEILSSLDSGINKEAALSLCSEMNDKINSSIVAFQFYDRLQQSLSHVVDALKGLSVLVESPERLYNPIEWKKFQDEIRARFTMESEKIMFDAILQGKSIDEAIQLASTVENENEDDVEFF